MKHKFSIGKTVTIKGKKGSITLTCIGETDTHWLCSITGKKVDLMLSKKQVEQMIGQGKCDGNCEYCTLNPKKLKIQGGKGTDETYCYI